MRASNLFWMHNLAQSEFLTTIGIATYLIEIEMTSRLSLLLQLMYDCLLCGRRIAWTYERWASLNNLLMLLFVWNEASLTQLHHLMPLHLLLLIYGTTDLLTLILILVEAVPHCVYVLLVWSLRCAKTAFALE